MERCTHEKIDVQAPSRNNTNTYEEDKLEFSHLEATKQTETALFSHLLHYSADSANFRETGTCCRARASTGEKKNTTVYRYFSVSGIFLNMHPFEIVLHFSILALASTYTAATPDTRGLPEVGLNKRIRELVGKRAGPEDDYRNFDKRIRELIGKRTLGEDNFPEKRIRELIGKRAMTDSFDPFNKRIRELVGKRDFVYGEDLFNKDKRIRELVGKRNEVQEQNDMVDKRIRELLGKRGLSADENSDVFVMGVQDLLGKKPEDKRIRELVGKRTRNGAINKRVRELVG